jgi:hypothetical protein
LTRLLVAAIAISALAALASAVALFVGCVHA